MGQMVVRWTSTAFMSAFGGPDVNVPEYQAWIEDIATGEKLSNVVTEIGKIDHTPPQILENHAEPEKPWTWTPDRSHSAEGYVAVYDQHSGIGKGHHTCTSVTFTSTDGSKSYGLLRFRLWFRRFAVRWCA